MTEYNETIEEKLTLLRQMADIGEALEILAGNLGQRQEDDDSFDSLLLERWGCIDRINAIDQSLPEDIVYESERLNEMITLLQKISASDKAAVERVTQETASLKQQISAQMERKKTMLVYGTDLLARKNIILDEEK